MMRLILAPAFLVPLLLTRPVLAQTETTRTVDQLAECRAVAGDAERLACFDRLAERIGAARSSGQLLVLDRKQVVERKRRAFGLAERGKDATAEAVGGVEDVAELDTKVLAAAPGDAPGLWRLQLANGMVWQSIDRLRFPPRAGAAIKFKTALLGGFRASIDGGRSFLVKRLR